MTTARVIFASLTGNNEEIAEFITSELVARGFDALQVEMSQFNEQDLLQCDLAVIVPYTYGEGDLPEEGLDLYDALSELNLTHLTYAVAGSGDIAYGDDFGLAVTKFDARLQSTGATCAVAPLLIDLRMDKTDQQRLRQFVAQIQSILERR